MVKNMVKDEIDNIIKEIKRTGLSLEVEIASFLETENWFTIQEVPYLDKDENKTRMIDLLALKNIGEKFTILVIAFRRSEISPWVFYARESSLELLESSIFGLLPISSLMIEKKDHLAIAHRTIFTGKDEVSEAVKQVSKALTDIMDTSEEIPIPAIQDIKLLKEIICIPIVIFDGRLYQFSSYENVDLKEVDFVNYFHFSKDAPLIKIIHKDHFKEWIKNVQTQLESN
jgi:hypothetical protein